MRKTLLMIIAALACGLSAMAQKTSVFAYTNQTLECLGVELDGSQTLRVSGVGRNKADSKEQAKKNAVWAVIFNGIQGGLEGCNTRPLVTEPNAKEKYEEYFNIFFMDNGDYKEYVSMEDTKRRSAKKAKSKATANYTITVRVLRAQLKQRLITDGVLKVEK